MKIVSLVKIGNESEIIESFVRYNFNFIDSMIIVSSCCIDNTLVILRNLIDEGFDIRLRIEKDIAFDERYLDNKYMKEIVDSDEFDLILPLDSDEFIAGNGNPRNLLEQLPLDVVSIVKWKNYAMTENDNSGEPFIPRRLTKIKKNYSGNNITKVIVPVGLARRTDIIMTAGRHAVVGNGVKNRIENNLWIAHYPVISLEQYKSMIYQESIKSIIRYNIGNSESFHKHNQRIGLERGNDIFEVANGYGLDKDGGYELCEEPLNMLYCTPETPIMKYVGLAKSDALIEIWRTGQLMAIKSYIYEMERQFDSKLPSILIYGAGNSAETIFNGIDDGIVNIWGYIDGDPVKELRIFNRRLIIPPAYVRFFRADKIVISSDKYYGEMYSTLVENGVEVSLISGAGYLLDLMLKKRALKGAPVSEGLEK